VKVDPKAIELSRPLPRMLLLPGEHN